MRNFSKYLPWIYALIVCPVTHADLSSDRLKQIVEINSGTANKEGVKKVQEWFGGELTKLGFESKLDNKNLLVATYKGQSPKFITLLAHADTVFEPSSKFQKFTQKADQATGPGIIDDKGGMIVILDGLKTCLSTPPRFSLRVVSSPDEETGSNDQLDDFKKLSHDTVLVLGFEPGLDDGSIVDSRRGGRWYLIKSQGKEAHAGRMHKAGINACVELSTKIAQISKLTDYGKNVTVSVGHMEGGQDKYNIVCGFAEAKLDTRFSSEKDGNDLHRKITAILNKEAVKGATTTFVVTDESSPFSMSASSKKYLKMYGVPSSLSGGVSDANHFAKEGIPVIDGLGPVGGKMHTDEEFISPPSLQKRSDALCRFIQSL